MNTVFVTIKATCPFFSIEEVVPEAKAVARLVSIKKMFSMHTAGRVIPGAYDWQHQTTPRKEGVLTVTTTVKNPTLF